MPLPMLFLFWPCDTSAKQVGHDAKAAENPQP